MSRPLGSTPTPASRDFSATTSRSASGAVTVLSAFGCCLGTLPLPSRGPEAQLNGWQYRRSPSHVPCKSRRPGSRRLYAGHRLANTRAPTKLIPGIVLLPGSDAI
jgi:hypothetical protein